ncbi:MAG: RHS repeat-associated core domain-containing protein [Candidatus Auribacterota bacterium]
MNKPLLFSVFIALHVLVCNVYSFDPAYLCDSSDLKYTVQPADTAETPETELTEEVLTKVEELDYNPVKIYEWIKNNIDYIPYYGSKLGATGTLYERKANDYDQCSLLIAMYRAMGIPCRYVRGYVAIPKEKLANLFGVEDVDTAEWLLMASALCLIQGPSNATYEALTLYTSSVEYPNHYLFYHVWVEAFLPYHILRGKNLDSFLRDNTSTNSEKMWVPLDPSFKQFKNKFSIPYPSDFIVNPVEFTQLYIHSTEEVMPNKLYLIYLSEFLKNRYPAYTLDNFLFERNIVQTRLNLLPTDICSDISVYQPLSEVANLDNKERYRLALSVTYGSNTLAFDSPIPISQLYNQKLAVTFEIDESITGATYYDKVETIINTPSLKTSPNITPHIWIENQKVKTGVKLSLFEDETNLKKTSIFLQHTYPKWFYFNTTVQQYQFIDEIGDPNKTKARDIAVCSFLAICLNYNLSPKSLLEKRFETLKVVEELIDTGEAGKAVCPPIIDILYTLGLQYYTNINADGQELANYMNILLQRARSHAFIKQELTQTGTTIEVGSYNLDVNYNYVDVFPRKITNVNDTSPAQRNRYFALVTGMNESAHEHKIFEQYFSVKAMSTMQYLRTAHKAETNEVLYIDKDSSASISAQVSDTDISTMITTHFLDTNNSNKVMIIPLRKANEAEAGAATGYGYISVNKEDGFASYTIVADDGAISGGGSSTFTHSNTFSTVQHSYAGNNYSNPNPDHCNVRKSSQSSISTSIFDFSGSSSTFHVPQNTSTADLLFNYGNTLDASLYTSVIGAAENLGNLAANNDTAIQTFNNESKLTKASSTVPKSNINGLKQDNYSTSNYQASDPVDMRTGEFFAENTDIMIPGQLPIIINRTYSSQQESYDLLGYGWLFNLDYYLWGNPQALALADGEVSNDPVVTSVVLRLSEDDGAVIEYFYESEDTSTIVFKPSPYSNNELVNDNVDTKSSVSSVLSNRIYFNKTTKKFTYYSHTGLTKVFGYHKYLKDGETIKERIYLEETSDINCNKLTYTYQTNPSHNGYGLPKHVENSSGSYVDFEYDSHSRLSKAISSDRREVQYFYDEIWNLVKVIDASGKIIKYEYAVSDAGNPTHNLTKIIKPDNRILENIYDDEKVIEQRMSIGFNANPIRTARFVYGDLDSSGNRTTTLYTSIYEDEDDNIVETVQEYTFKDVWANYAKCILNFDSATNLGYDSALNATQNITKTCTAGEGGVAAVANGQSISIPVTTRSSVKTIEFDFKFSALPTSTFNIYDQGSYIIQYDGATNKVKAIIGTTHTLISVTNDFAADTWYHVSLSLDTEADAIMLKINGLIENYLTSPLLNLIDGTEAATLTNSTSGVTLYLDNVHLYDIVKQPGSNSPLWLMSFKQRGFNDSQFTTPISVNRTWDDDGNLTSVTNENNYVTVYAYDSNDRLISQTVNGNEITTYTYLNSTDPILLNKLATITDPLLNKTEFTYEETTSNPNFFKGALKSKKVFRKVDTEYIGVYEESYTYNTLGLLATKTVAVDNTQEQAVYSYSYDRFGNVVSITNPLGETVEYAYDEWGNRVRETNPLGDSSLFYYDNANRVIKAVDALGNITQFIYDLNGNKKAEINQLGNMTTYLYDFSDSLLGIMDPLGNTVITDYDIFGNKLFVTNQNGNIRGFEYDALNRVVTETDYLLQDDNTYIYYETKYTYDKIGNITKKEIHEVDGTTDTTVSSDEYTYNHRNQVLTEKHYSDTDSFIQTEHVYDAVGNETEIKYYIDVNGTPTLDKYVSMTYSLEWDGNYRLKKAETYKENGTTDERIDSVEYDYDNRGNKTSEEDFMGNTTLYEYNSADRLIEKRIPLIENPVAENDNHYSIIEYAYDHAGRLIAQTDPNGNTTTTEYDKLGRVTSVIDPEGRQTQFIYDEAGNTIREISPTGNTTYYTYDALNRVIEAYDEAGNTTTKLYDGVGNVVQVTDANGNITRYQYDELNRVVLQTDPLGNTIEQTYTLTSTGNLHTTVKAMMDSSTSKYRERKTVTDWLGRTIQEIDDPNNTALTTTYTYDDYNRVTSKTTPNSDTVTYTYDNAGNLESTTCATDHSIDVKYTYDELGRRLSMLDATGGTYYKYDAQGRLIVKVAPNNMSVAYTYDKAGNHTVMRFTGLNKNPGQVDRPAISQKVEYEYNNANEIISVKLNGTTVADYEFNYGGLPEKKTYGNGTYTSYVYDSLDRLSYLSHHKSDNSVFASQLYTYDKLSNRVKIVESLNGSAYTSAFRYDGKNQLIRKLYEDDQGTVHKLTYQYDGTGNRTQLIDAHTQTDTTNYTYNTLNQLSTLNRSFTQGELEYVNLLGVFKGNRNSTAISTGYGWLTTDYDDMEKTFFIPLAVVPESEQIVIQATGEADITLDCDLNNDIRFNYDENGNLNLKSENGVQAYYLWDALDRLTDVYYTDSQNTIHHEQYVYNGDGKRIYTIVDGSLTGRLYDGDQVIAEYDETGTVTAQFVHGSGLGADVGSMICSESIDNGAVAAEWFCYNWRGDVIAVTDGGGAALSSYRYDAFGQVIGSGMPGRGFSSKEYNDRTSLSYFGARYYDASIGRFISRDPLGFVDGPNEYIYCANNPIGCVDPWGLSARQAQHASSATMGMLAASWLMGSSSAYASAAAAVISAATLPAVYVGASAGIAGYYINKVLDPTFQGYGTVSYPEDRLPFTEVFPGGSINVPLTLPPYKTLPNEGPIVLDNTPPNIADTGIMWTPSYPTKLSDYIETFPALPQQYNDYLEYANTGQTHHVISKKIYDALSDHPILGGQYSYRDDGLTTQATNSDAHKGYQKWHREIDAEVSNWISRMPDVTTYDFENYLNDIYNRPELKEKFPDGIGR